MTQPPAPLQGTLPIDYAALQPHPLSETVVSAIADLVNTPEKTFFRVHVAYYLAVVASMMRAQYRLPGAKRPDSVNLFAVNLAPSGFGKGLSTTIIEEDVIANFRKGFLARTLPHCASVEIPKLSLARSHRKGTDPDDELRKTEAEFDSHGALLFSFDKATPAAVKQIRQKLLMAGAGSMNLQTDEIGSNLTSNADIMMMFCELFDGRLKSTANKSTVDNVRSEEIFGVTPSNVMMFGVPSGLLDSDKTEDMFIKMLVDGYARRSFFGFVPEAGNGVELCLLTPEEEYDKAMQGAANVQLQAVSDTLERLADMVNVGKILDVPKHTALVYYQYKNECKVREAALPIHDGMRRRELGNRAHKVIKLATTYAFVDSMNTVEICHLESAIALAEESGDAFSRIVKRERPYVAVAKYLAAIPEEVTETDLMEDLPQVFKGSRGQKQELVNQAIAWGYRNNVLIKKRFTDSVEFLRGQSLQSTDLSRIRVSYSSDIADGYLSQEVPFDELHRLVTCPGMHWINHLLDETRHRADKHVVAGFNMIVIDVDQNKTLQMAKQVLQGYRALYYTTKRHTPDQHRFRILMPTSYTLDLDGADFKAFMNNLFEWLPFGCDDQTGQRSRKWLSHGTDDGTSRFEYTDGQLLDPLPFIPLTVKNVEHNKAMAECRNLDNLERWFIMNTGDGNRSHQLHRYSRMLVDNNLPVSEVQEKVMALNGKLSDSLPEAEILQSVMVTAAKAVRRRDASGVE